MKGVLSLAIVLLLAGAVVRPAIAETTGAEACRKKIYSDGVYKYVVTDPACAEAQRKDAATPAAKRARDRASEEVATVPADERAPALEESRPGERVGPTGRPGVASESRLESVSLPEDSPGAGARPAKARPARQAKERQVASSETTEISLPPKAPELITRNGVMLGLNYVFPFVRYEHTVARQLSLGATGQFVNHALPSGSLEGYAFFATLSYTNDEAFRGIWLHGGLGYASLSGAGALAAHVSGPALLFDVGWRWAWEQGLCVGVAIGAQYVAGSTESLRASYSGLLPSILIDVGLTF